MVFPTNMAAEVLGDINLIKNLAAFGNVYSIYVSRFVDEKSKELNYVPTVAVTSTL